MKSSLTVRVVCTVILLHLIIDPVYSIKCFQCMSGVSPDCTSSDRAVLKKFETDCTIPASTAQALGGLGLGINVPVFTRCAKGLKDGELTRACGFATAIVKDNDCLTKEGATACICTTDFCNAAPAQRGTLSGLFCPLSVALLVVIKCLL